MGRKLRMVLIHGTWSSSQSWANEQSEFFKWLRADLGGAFDDFAVSPIEWSGSNRWRARAQTAERLNDTLETLRSQDDGSWDYLIVGHSHGGNIATEGARQRIRKDSTFPLRGVVCLNTPFLTQELRASNVYLAPWFFLTALVALLLQISPELFAGPLTSALISIFSDVTAITINPRGLTAGLILVLATLGALTFVGRHLLRTRDREEAKWGPRPKVLCLSCADDEAITLLGLGEGVANLPQLLFHPVALVFLIGTWVGLLLLDGAFRWCGGSLECWNAQLTPAALLLTSWLLLATLGGLLGTLLVVTLFGLSLSLLFESMVSRILVTYTPLRPASAYFRGIVDLKVKWSPLQLFHSQIYRSKVTVEEIAGWMSHISAPTCRDAA